MTETEREYYRVLVKILKKIESMGVSTNGKGCY